MSDDPDWIEQVRADLRQRKDVDDFRGYKNAAPLCDKHQPDGGTRGLCVICAGELLQHALSRISYACETPNEMQCSSYDVHMNEDAVVAQVVAQAERIRVLERRLSLHDPCNGRMTGEPPQYTPECRVFAERIRVLERLVIDAAYTLEKARIWNGMGWTYNPLHPVHYSPMPERLRNECENIEAIRARPTV